jgi:hypothetical protein
MLWHGLEIGLMRVGEPFIDDEKNFFGVIILKFTFQSGKKYQYLHL